MFGSPGAGKGTASGWLSEYLDIPHISTGAIIREHVEMQTMLGRKAKAYLDEGHLVPDDLMIDLVSHALDAYENWILDGYPRTVAQAESMLERHRPTAVIYLNVDPKTVTKRLINRGRADDTEAVIAERLQVYEQQTSQVIEFLGIHSDFQIHEVDGSGTIDETREAIEAELAASMRETLIETEEQARCAPGSANPLLRPDI